MDCEKCRNFAMESIPDFFTGPYINDVNDIVDKRVTHRNNGLMLIGSFKPGKGISAGQYRPKISGTSFSDEFYIISEDDFQDLDSGCYKDIYNFVFEKPDDDWKVEKTKTKKKKMLLPSKCKKNVSDSQFNLQEFLRVTAEYVPKNAEYKQIMAYLKKNNFEAQNLCNRAWNYSSNETSKFVNKICSADVSKASMIRILNLHATLEWDERKIWQDDVTSFTEFNDVMRLPKSVWYESEINEIFRNIFCQTWGDNDSRFLYRETALEMKGRYQLKAQRWIISQGSPFATFDRKIRIREKCSREDAFKFLDSLKKPKKNLRNFLNEIHEIKKKDIDTLLKFCEQKGLTIQSEKKKKLSELFNSCYINDLIKKYRTFVIEPYLENFDTRTAGDAINIWQRNPLLDFDYTEKIDIKKTKTWFWLKTILCNDDTYKLEWLCQYHHEKIVNAYKKIEKILVLFSEETGSGKSSHNAFMSQLTGSHTTLKVDDITEILKEKNAEFLNRLVIYIDDAQKLKKAESEKLKSKTTEKYYTYRRLYENGIKMKALHDYIISTNKKILFRYIL